MDQEKVWDAIASSWDARRNRVFPEVIEFLRDTNGNYLDLGCGTGRNFLKLSGAKCYGVDFSDGQLKLAREAAEKKGVPVDLRKSDATKLPFEDNFFDKVLFHSVIHCVDSGEDRKKALEEIYRVLRVGGVAMITAWGRKSPRLKNKEKETVVPWTNNEKEYLRSTYIYDFDELEDLLKGIGFKIISGEERENLVFIVGKG
jgi:ubiquinone/menaquinone biosynthesis C-methylase UbiE